MARQISRMSGRRYRPQPPDDDGEAQWASRRSLKPGDTLQSASFHSGVRDWQITASGNAEFCNVIVRGYIVVGGAAQDVNNGGVTISGVKLSDGTVTADKLVAGTITAAQIHAGTITANEIATGTITATQIAASTITADRMNVSTLSAISANLGTITAGTITGATVRTAAAGAWVVLDSTGIKQYDATAQRAQLLNDGSGWLGATDRFRWTTAGVVEMNGAAILPATVTDAQLNVYNVPTISGLVVTDHSPTAAKVSWSAFSLTLNGTSYAIAAGNSDKKYLYWVLPNLTLTGSDTLPAMAANQAMVLYNNAGVGIPSLMQNFVYADFISVASLSAINANMGTITAGTITGATIRTAASGARVEMNGTDIGSYNSANAKLAAMDSAGFKIMGGSVYAAERAYKTVDADGVAVAYMAGYVDANTVSADMSTIAISGKSSYAYVTATAPTGKSAYGVLQAVGFASIADVQLNAPWGAASSIKLEAASTFAIGGPIYAQYGFGDYVLIRDEKTKNTGGGTFNSGAWRTCDLNTEVSDVGGVASVASNQITLLAGTYRAEISAPSTNYHHQAMLYNVTDSAVVAIGTSEYANGVQTRSAINCTFTITGTKVFEVRHQGEGNVPTTGFGSPCNYTTEVYTVVELWRLYHA